VFYVGLAACWRCCSAGSARHQASRSPGFYNKQVDTSFRMGMMWFIFSEVMFFAAFFGALFYARQFALPWLGGEGDGAPPTASCGQGFERGWPTNGPARSVAPSRPSRRGACR
jgi:cytochrome c oxidase subunit 3